MRATGPLLKVLNAMLAEPDAEFYGLELIRATSLKSGTLYPVLDRLESVGWLKSRWEHPEKSTSGGPRRRFYRLTAQGVHEARQVMLEHGVGRAVAWN